MKPKMIQVDYCRICHSKELIDLGIHKQFYLLNVDQTIPLSYALCSHCHFLFHSSYVGDEFLNYYYQKSPMLRRKDPSEQEINQYQRQASFLERTIDLKNKKILEIGAHTGGFLVYLKNKHQSKVYFDELSEEARKVLLSVEGLNDYRADTKKEKVDIIVLRHVFEHIFDLTSFMNYLTSILNEQGVLFIEVPDWSCWDASTDPLIFEHLNQFNTFNLALLLKQHGFMIETQEKSIVADDPATPNRVVRLIAKPSSYRWTKKDILKDEFKNFYKINHEKVNEAVNQLVAKLDKRKKVALYPASHQTFMTILESDILKANIIGMFDIDQKKHGRVVNGVKVFPAEQLKQENPDLILLLTYGGFEFEIKKFFNSLGLKSEIITLRQLLNS